MLLLTPQSAPRACDHGCGNAARYITQDGALSCALCPLKLQLDSLRLDDALPLVRWLARAVECMLALKASEPRQPKTPQARAPGMVAPSWRIRVIQVLERLLGNHVPDWHEASYTDITWTARCTHKRLATLLMLAREYLRDNALAYEPEAHPLNSAPLRLILGKDTSRQGQLDALLRLHEAMGGYAEPIEWRENATDSGSTFDPRGTPGNEISGGTTRHDDLATWSILGGAPTEEAAQREAEAALRAVEALRLHTKQQAS